DRFSRGGSRLAMPSSPAEQRRGRICRHCQLHELFPVPGRPPLPSHLLGNPARRGTVAIRSSKSAALVSLPGGGVRVGPGPRLHPFALLSCFYSPRHSD